MVRANRGLRVLCALISCCLLACCAGRNKQQDYSEDIANVYVSAYPAVPWASISDKLEPKNNLSTADARAMAALTTQSQVSQVLSVLSGGLGVGLPGNALSRTTTTDATGTSTVTTKALTPGNVPTSAGGSSVALSDGSLAPDLTKNPFANGVDATTQLVGGLGVYQLAQILDNQISKELLPKGYQAYLVTFQVNLQPKRRDLPYDAYVNITLMPGSWHKAITTSQSVSMSANELSPIIVYPLIVTDAMESSSAGRSVESIRQAELALSGVLANVGVAADVKKAKDELSSMLGSDRNSLVTAGRVSDNTIRIRLGAQFGGSNKFAIVPRTQNISVVVFTKTGAEEDGHLDKLAVITNTTFVNSEHGGDALPSSREDRDRLARNVRSVVAPYGFTLNPACGSGDDQAGDLLRAADRGDYVYLSKCLLVISGVREGSSSAPRASFSEGPKASDNVATASACAASGCQSLLLVDTSLADRKDGGHPNGNEERFTPFEESKLRRVFAGLMQLQADSRYSKLTIQLADFKSSQPHAPDLQLAFLSDGKAGSKVTLRGAANVEPGKLKPILSVTRDGKVFSLYPTSVDVDASGVVTVGFPGIASSRLMTTVMKSTEGKPAEPTSIAPEPIKLLWRYAKTGTAGISSDDLVAGLTYEVQMLAADDSTPPNPVSVTSSVLRPDSTNTAKLTIFVDKWDAPKAALVLRVSNADIRAVEPAVALDASKKGLPLTGGTSLTLTLSNISSAATVQLKTFAGTEQQGSVIALPVEPIVSSSK